MEFCFDNKHGGMVTKNIYGGPTPVGKCDLLKNSPKIWLECLFMSSFFLISLLFPIPTVCIAQVV